MKVQRKVRKKRGKAPSCWYVFTTLLEYVSGVLQPKKQFSGFPILE
jgi:hypothetical protein